MNRRPQRGCAPTGGAAHEPPAGGVETPVSTAAHRKRAWKRPTVRTVSVEGTATGTKAPNQDFPEFGSTVYMEPS